MWEQNGRDGGSESLLKPNGGPYPGSPFIGADLPGPWAAVVDGDDNGDIILDGTSRLI
jgi:hypothetical protein